MSDKLSEAAPREVVLVRKARSAVRLVTYRGGRLATRIANLINKRARHIGIRGVRVRRIAKETVKNGVLTAANLVRRGVRRLLRIHKPFVRAYRRSARQQERRAAVTLERAVERDVRARAARGRPLILGPWISEVGFEVLYWIPFLRWLKAECNWDADRALAVSRGGVGWWYGDVAAHYMEIFEQIDPLTFVERSAERREAGQGSHKQLALSDLDRELVAAARRRPGFSDALVVHPSDMYRLFRHYWLGHRGVSHVQERTRFVTRRPAGLFDLSSLPTDYVAVKAYTAASLPDSPGNRRVIDQIVATLAARVDVVTLDTGLTVDDHADYGLERHPRVFTLDTLMTPANNLGLQSAVIANARAFVGTCGSLTWLAPMLGVDTVALMSDARFLRTHLLFARQVYLGLECGRFATVDVTALDALGLDLAGFVSTTPVPAG